MKKLFFFSVSLLLIASFFLSSCFEKQFANIHLMGPSDSVGKCLVAYNPVCGKVEMTIPSKTLGTKRTKGPEFLTFLNQCYLETYSDESALLKKGVCDLDPRIYEVTQDKGDLLQTAFIRYNHYIIGAEGKDLCDSYTVDWGDGTQEVISGRDTECNIGDNTYSFNQKMFSHNYTQTGSYDVSLRILTKAEEEIFSGTKTVVIE